MKDKLQGTFIESCSCEIVCGCCWVDTPSFDQMVCSGLAAWSFEAGSTLSNIDVSGTRACVISTHAGTKKAPKRAVAVLYIDAAPAKFALLKAAFENGFGPLASVKAMIAQLLPGFNGKVLPVIAADITHLANDQTGLGSLTVKNKVDQSDIAKTTVKPSGPAPIPVLQLTGRGDGLGPLVTVGYAEELWISQKGFDAQNNLLLIDLDIAIGDTRSASVCKFSFTQP
jgi:hypothetical protein